MSEAPDRKTASGLGALGRALKSSGAAGRRNDPVAGFLWITVSMALLAALGAVGRHAALSGLDPFQVTFFRNFFCVAWMLPLLTWRGFELVKTEQIRLYGMRVALSLLSMMAFFHALALIPLGEVTAISFLSPLFGTLFAILILGEKVRIRRWTALAIGFIGAMIMLRPGAGTLSFGHLAALVSAVTVGLISPLVKQLTLKDDADRIVFLTNLLLTPLSLVPALFVWKWPDAALWPWLIVMGACAVVGHMALVRGYAAVETSLGLTFKFTRLPFAVALGYFAFGETIDTPTWIGALIIFAATLYVTHREAELARAGKSKLAGAMASAETLTPLDPRP